MYDTLSEPTDILVTGSARLNVYKKGGDSLLGRAFHFRMHPFSIAELDNPKQPNTPEQTLEALRTRRVPASAERTKHMDALVRWGGFPEPFLKASDPYARLWRRSRTEKIIREDVRDLTRIQLATTGVTPATASSRCTLCATKKKKRSIFSSPRTPSRGCS